MASVGKGLARPVDAEAEDLPAREVFASSILAIEFFPEYVQVVCSSGMNTHVLTLTPTAYHQLAVKLALGPIRMLN